jgi:exodeoxyribonuclease VII large subunit
MPDLVVTVSQLNAYIGRKIGSDAMLKNIKVRGEISNFKINSSGSAFFTLKDAAAAVSCILFSYTGEEIEDGRNVTVEANLNVYEKEGRLSLVVHAIEETGLGELFIRLEQVKRKLYEEGLFDAAHKKKLPILPGTLGIVTSASGAAMHDIIQVAKRRCPGIAILIYPAKVQGEGAAEEVIAGIEYFNREKSADVLIVGRGGGSFEDLFAFNEEAVARAVYASEIPVVSAVGHEVDYTLTDLAADMRAPTPSAAAELCVPDKEGIRRMLRGLKEKMEHGVLTRVITSKTALNALKNAILVHSPSQRLADFRNDFKSRERMLETGMQNLLKEKRSRLELVKSLLGALNPYDTLKRGYAIVKKQDGHVASNIRSVQAGENVMIYLYGGMARANIEKIEINGEVHEEKI